MVELLQIGVALKHYKSGIKRKILNRTEKEDRNRIVCLVLMIRYTDFGIKVKGKC